MVFSGPYSRLTTNGIEDRILSISIRHFHWKLSESHHNPNIISKYIFEPGLAGQYRQSFCSHAVTAEAPQNTVPLNLLPAAVFQLCIRCHSLTLSFSLPPAGPSISSTLVPLISTPVQLLGFFFFLSKLWILSCCDNSQWFKSKKNSTSRQDSYQ